VAALLETFTLEAMEFHGDFFLEVVKEKSPWPSMASMVRFVFGIRS
jgi:hypothetical protein